MTHGPDCEYPLTHLCVFNSSNFQIHGPRSREEFHKNCRMTERFAAEFGLEALFLDTNFHETLGEVNLDAVGIFRRVGCVLALQELFSVFLLSSDYAITDFAFDLADYGYYEPLIAHCVSAEAVRFYSYGGDVRRWEKIEALAGWEPSQRWLHSCYGGVAGDRGCGFCKKCKRDLAILYGLGRLDQYRAVYDVEGYLARLPENLAYVYLGAEKDIYLRQTVELFKQRHITVPPQTRVLQDRLGEGIRRMKAAKEKENGN